MYIHTADVGGWGLEVFAALMFHVANVCAEKQHYYDYDYDYYANLNLLYARYTCILLVAKTEIANT